MAAVRAYRGHGISGTFHTSPRTPHDYEPESDTIIEPGMLSTVEPVSNLGGWGCRTSDDGWTAVTADGSRSLPFRAHPAHHRQGRRNLTVP